MALKEDLMERLKILEENMIISGQIAEFSRRVVDLVFLKNPDVGESSATMFITHLAMAGQRVMDGEDEMPLEHILLDSVKQEPIYKEAVEFLQEILTKTDIEFPQAEKDFLAVHLCNLLNGQEKQI